MQQNPTYPPEILACALNASRQLSKRFVSLLSMHIIGLFTWVAVPWVLTAFIPYARSGLGTLVGFGYILVMGSILIHGFLFLYHRAAQGDPVKIRDVVNYLKTRRAAIATSGLTLAGIQLFFMPFFGVLVIRWVFAPNLLIERNMEAREAIKESRRMTDGQIHKLVAFFGLGALVYFLIGIPFLWTVVTLKIPMEVGGIPLVPIAFLVIVGFSVSIWITLAVASLYHALRTSGEGPVGNSLHS